MNCIDDNDEFQKLAIQHGASIFNVGEFDEHYAMTKDELISFAKAYKPSVVDKPGAAL